MYFDNVIQIRLCDKERARIERVVDKIMIDHDERRYLSLSHFLRCAIEKLLRDEEYNLITKNGK